MMHYRRLMLASWLLVFASLACVDADGNRVTFQQWCETRNQPPAEEANSHPPHHSAATSGVVEDEDEPAIVSKRPSERVVNEKSDAPTSNQPREIRRRDGSRRPSAQAIYSDVLLVNSDKLSVEDILEPINSHLESLAKTLPPVAYYEDVSQLVRQQIIESVAQLLIWRRAQGLITEEMEPQLEKAIDKMERDRINREFQGRETLYEKYLAKHGKTRAQVRERLKRSIVIDSYLRDHLLPLVPAPRKPDLLDYYERNKAQFSPTPKRELCLIDLPVASFLDVVDRENPEAIRPAREAAKAQAEEALAAIKKGEAFDEVARRLSKGVNARNGGNWGLIEHPLKGRWEKPSLKLFDLQEGEVSEIIEAADSFFIVKVGKIEGSNARSFADAQQEIAQVLRQRKFAKLRAEFLQEELERSTISSLDEFVAEVMKAVPRPQ